MFMVMSALTASGLNTVNVSQLTTFQQVELVILMIMGSQVLVSYFTIAYRKHIFEKRFEDIVKMEKENRKAQRGRTGAAIGMTGAMFGLTVMSSFGKGRIRRRSQPTKLETSPASPTATDLSRGGISNQEAREEAELSPTSNSKREDPRIGFLEPIRENRPLHQRSHSTTTGHSIYATQTHQSESTRRRPQTGDSKLGDGFNVQTFVKEQKVDLF